MNDTILVGGCLVLAVRLVAILGAYLLVALGLARILSWKWHPDGGKEER